MYFYFYFNILVEYAFVLKEEGNAFFKQKDYKRANAKYARVLCYTRALLPSENSEVAGFQSMSKKLKVN